MSKKPVPLGRMAQIVERVLEQDAANVKKWGDDQHPMVMVAVISEEIGEVARAVLEKNREACIRECIDAAAVLLRLACYAGENHSLWSWLDPEVAP